MLISMWAHPGGGAVQTAPHSTAADVVDSTGHVTSYPSALGKNGCKYISKTNTKIINTFCDSPAVGRWGLACATQDNKVAFAGGKAYGSTVKRTTDGTAAADTFA
jgi:hypothetical protein